VACFIPRIFAIILKTIQNKHFLAISFEGGYPFQIWLISEQMAKFGRLAFSDLCVDTMAMIVTFCKNQPQAAVGQVTKFDGL